MVAHGRNLISICSTCSIFIPKLENGIKDIEDFKWLKQISAEYSERTLSRKCLDFLSNYNHEHSRFAHLEIKMYLVTKQTR